MKKMMMILIQVLITNVCLASLDVRIAIDIDNGGFSNKNDSGLYGGVDVDIINRTCASNHWNCQFVDVPFKDLMSGLVGFEVIDNKIDKSKPFTKKWDLAIGALDAKVSRLQFMKFSTPYFAGRHLFLTRKGSQVDFNQTSGYPTPGVNKEVVVAAQKGTALHKELLLAYGKYKRNGIKVVTYNDIEHLKSIGSSIDAVLTFTGSGEQRAAKELGFEFTTKKLIGVIDASELRGVAVGIVDSNKGLVLKDALDNEINKISAHCEVSACDYNEIVEKNFGSLPFNPWPATAPTVDFN